MSIHHLLLYSLTTDHTVALSMGHDDDAIVETALQHLGSVAERLDHYGPTAESSTGIGPDGDSSSNSNSGYGVLDLKQTTPTSSKKRSKGDSQDGDEKKPKKTRQTREYRMRNAIQSRRNRSRNMTDIPESCDGMSLGCAARASNPQYHSRCNADTLPIACRARK